MAMNFELEGRLARNPEHRTGNDNTPIARVTVATDRTRSDQADFFTVTVFGTAATQLADATKGDPITISGTARQNIWDDANGTTHYDIQFIGRQVDWAPRPTRHQPAHDTNATAAHGAGRA